MAEEEAGDELRVRDERRVRPRGKEREAWEAMAKANSRLRPARTPERSTNEPAPPSASSSMDGRGGSYPLSPALTCLPSLAGVRVCLHRQLIRLTTRGGRRSWNWIQPNWIGFIQQSSIQPKWNRIESDQIRSSLSYTHRKWIRKWNTELELELEEHHRKVHSTVLTIDGLPSVLARAHQSPLPMKFTF